MSNFIFRLSEEVKLYKVVKDNEAAINKAIREARAKGLKASRVHHNAVTGKVHIWFAGKQ